MTHPEALEFLTRIGATHEGDSDRWTLTIGTSIVYIAYRAGNPSNAKWRARPSDEEVDTCLAADPQQALLDLGAELSNMAAHCSSFGLAVTRLAV